jgi:hypothetical protein
MVLSTLTFAALATRFTPASRKFLIRVAALPSSRSASVSSPSFLNEVLSLSSDDDSASFFIYTELLVPLL